MASTTVDSLHCCCCIKVSVKSFLCRSTESVSGKCLSRYNTRVLCDALQLSSQWTFFYDQLPTHNETGYFLLYALRNIVVVWRAREKKDGSEQVINYFAPSVFFLSWLQSFLFCECVKFHMFQLTSKDEKLKIVHCCDSCTLASVERDIHICSFPILHRWFYSVARSKLRLLAINKIEKKVEGKVQQTTKSRSFTLWILFLLLSMLSFLHLRNEHPRIHLSFRFVTNVDSVVMLIKY